MNTNELATAAWFKSSKSDGQNNCVEVARNLPGIVAVRDSKEPDGATLVFTAREWAAFTGGVREGKFEV